MKAEDTVKAILKKADKYVRDLANDTEGNFKPEDMEGIHFDAYVEIYKAGMREVVELVHLEGIVSRDRKSLSISYLAWQAFLKERGL